MKPHIPLGRHLQPADDEHPEDARRSDDQDSSVYCIYDENDKPLVIDLQAIDDCQKLREITPFEENRQDERERPAS